MNRAQCPQHAPASLTRQRATASIELIGTLPLLLLGLLVCVQALLLVLSMCFAQVTVERAAQGWSTARATATVPSGWRDRARIERGSTHVRVTIGTPVVLPGVGSKLDVSARAARSDA